MMITEEQIKDIFYQGKIEKNVTVAPLFIRLRGETYLVKGTMRDDLACQQCSFHGDSCPRDLEGNLLCSQMETAGRIAYFEKC